jgi:pimeloyl-ACP methyl ester carboxylesterase
MSSIPTLHGITSKMIETPRLRMHVLFSGPEDGIPVLFLDGNVSSATFWEETMLALPPGFRAIAPDKRSCGGSEFKPLDATRAMMDYVDDFLGLTDVLNIERFHVVGWSMAGNIVMTMIPVAGERILSATLVATGSPFGFGGCTGLDGRPIYPDFAASRAGLANPDFVKRLSDGDRGEESPTSPRNIINSHYFKPPFRSPREKEFLSSVLSVTVSDHYYPGDLTGSENWPGIAPGVYGPLNALSPKYVGDSVERLVGAADKTAILRIRGADDAIVGDHTFYDFAVLGQAELVPDYPGPEVHPTQPMVSQVRAVLGRYAANGGRFRELVFEECGHSPFIEKSDAFNAAFHAHLAGE